MNYIARTIPELDYVRRYKDSFTFISPPKIDLEFIPDSLYLTAEEKIGELIDRFTEVKSRFTNNYRYIKNVAVAGKWDSDSVFFWSYLEGIAYEETKIIKKWLRYWSRLYELATNEKLIEYPKNSLSDDDIQRAREFPIEDLFEGDLKRVGNKFVGLCPFHSEKTPSFTIFSDNKYRCFGCGEYGDAISFIQKTRNIDFVTAVKELS